MFTTWRCQTKMSSIMLATAVLGGDEAGRMGGDQKEGEIRFGVGERGQ